MRLKHLMRGINALNAALMGVMGLTPFVETLKRLSQIPPNH